MEKSELTLNENVQVKYVILHKAFVAGEETIEELILGVLLKKFISKNTRLAQKMMGSAVIREKSIELTPYFSDLSTLTLEQ